MTARVSSAQGTAVSLDRVLVVMMSAVGDGGSVGR